MGRLNKIKTAVANGFNLSQTKTLAQFSDSEFVKRINDMPPLPGKKKKWIFNKD